MTIRLDEAVFKYADAILEIRNKPEVRGQMVSDGIISSEAHRKWIRQFAEDDNEKFAMVFLVFDVFVGFCHVKPATPTSLEWSFYKNPDRRDVSGTVMCAHFINRIFDRSNRKKILGRVKSSNIASYKCHLRLGFEETCNSPDMASFELRQEQWEKTKHIFL